MQHEPITLPERRGRQDGAELTFVGTATMLIRIGGFTLLTDPNFLHQGEHAKLGYGLRSRRLTEPAMMPDELPDLDVIVLSHHHGDHFDETAARRLDKRVPIVTTPHASRKLRRQGFVASRPLRTWESQVVTRGTSSLKITSLPGRHGPGPIAALLPPVMGSLLEFRGLDRPPLNLYITGDTLVHDRLREIAERYPSIHVTLLHLGGTRVAGVLLTMDAAQGVELLRTVPCERAVPIHYDDYTVFRSPLEEFRAAVERSEIDTEVVYLDRGETYRFSLVG